MRPGERPGRPSTLPANRQNLYNRPGNENRLASRPGQPGAELLPAVLVRGGRASCHPAGKPGQAARPKAETGRPRRPSPGPPPSPKSGRLEARTMSWPTKTAMSTNETIRATISSARGTNGRNPGGELRGPARSRDPAQQPQRPAAAPRPTPAARPAAATRPSFDSGQLNRDFAARQRGEAAHPELPAGQCGLPAQRRWW